MIEVPVEVSTALLYQLDAICALRMDYYGLSTPTRHGDQIWAHRITSNIKNSPRILPCSSWYSPTRKWEDAGPIILDFLQHSSLPRSPWTLSEIIRHIIMVEYGDIVLLPQNLT